MPYAPDYPDEEEGEYEAEYYHGEDVDVEIDNQWQDFQQEVTGPGNEEGVADSAGKKDPGGSQLKPSSMSVGQWARDQNARLAQKSLHKELAGLSDGVESLGLHQDGPSTEVAVARDKRRSAAEEKSKAQCMDDNRYGRLCVSTQVVRLTVLVIVHQSQTRAGRYLALQR